MASVRTYWNALVSTRNAVASRLGVDVPTTDKALRAISNADVAVIAVVVKALTDKGVLTDDDLTAARQSAIGDVWNEEPNLP